MIIRIKNRGKLDKTTENWIATCNDDQIILPHRSSTDELFLEYHNDVVFKGTSVAVIDH